MSLVHAKCGSISNASKVFDKLPKTNVVLWTAMMTGCAHHGLAKKAINLFEQMLQANVKPTEISFVGVMFACSHAGLVDEGHGYFSSMSRYYDITPGTEHYVCMVVLGLSGPLDEAENVVNKMQFKLNGAVWETLLGVCRIHGNMEMVKRAAEHLLDLKTQDAGKYVVLSNLYSPARRWDVAANLRNLMEE
jgi:pentatricopeptide repeat protein